MLFQLKIPHFITNTVFVTCLQRSSSEGSLNSPVLGFLKSHVDVLPDCLSIEDPSGSQFRNVN